MTGEKSVSLFAPAKINFYLHVTGKRDDGYHLLDSLMVFAGVGDVIDARSADDLSLTIKGPFSSGLDADESNLVIKAAEALRKASGCQKGAALTLTKELPVASGIGGGSADAAAALKALSELWEISLPDDQMQEIALSLGADVPVCLSGRSSFVGGIGEDLSPPPPLPPCWLVLVNPGIAVSTPAVFKARSGGFSAPARFDESPEDAAHLAEILRERANDLEIPARTIAPAVDVAFLGLGASEDCLMARMSGSGATCFGLFETEEKAQSAAAKISEAKPDWWVAAAPLLT